MSCNRSILAFAVYLLSTVLLANATSVSEIQGISFQSPLAGQLVRDVTGVVTAKYIRFRTVTGSGLAGNLQMTSGARTVCVYLAPLP